MKLKKAVTISLVSYGIGVLVIILIGFSFGRENAFYASSVNQENGAAGGTAVVGPDGEVIFPTTNNGGSGGGSTSNGGGSSSGSNGGGSSGGGSSSSGDGGSSSSGGSSSGGSTGGSSGGGSSGGSSNNSGSSGGGSTGGGSTGGGSSGGGTGGGSSGGGGGGGSSPTPPSPPACGAGGPCSAAQVATHSSRSNCWVIYNSKVYNVTGYVSEHPGGQSVFNNNTCGRDITPYINGTTEPVSGERFRHGSSDMRDLDSYFVGNLG